MIPYKSIYKSRLDKGGDITNPELFSLISSCLLNIKPDSTILCDQKSDYKITSGCLILQTIHYSLEHDPDYNYALGLIEFQQFMQEKYPKRSLCHMLSFQKNLECETNPTKQKKIQILYEKDFERDEKKNGNKILIDPKEISQVFDVLAKTSLMFKENKNPDEQIEFLQIKIIFEKTNQKAIKGWTFFFDGDNHDIGDIGSYLKQNFLIKDPSEHKKKIEGWFKNNPESLYYFYMMMGRRRKDDLDKAIVCFIRAQRFAKSVFGELSREVLLAEFEQFLIGDDEETKMVMLHRLLNKMQMKFLQCEQEDPQNHLNKQNRKDSNQEELKENYKEQENLKESEEETKEDFEKESNSDNESEGNEIEDDFDEEIEGLDDVEEFVVNPNIDLSNSKIHPIDKLLFASIILEQESLSFKSYDKVREIFEENPYNKEKLAFCYFKIAEEMLDIIDARTSYIKFFGDVKFELFSLQGVQKYLMNAHKILSEGFGEYDFKVKDVVFELIRVNKRLKNFTEAYKYCLIALHILKIYHWDEGGLIKSHQKRLQKEKYRRYQALFYSVYMISKNNALKKVLKRKDIFIEMIMKFV